MSIKTRPHLHQSRVLPLSLEIGWETFASHISGGKSGSIGWCEWCN